MVYNTRNSFRLLPSSGILKKPIENTISETESVSVLRILVRVSPSSDDGNKFVFRNVLLFSVL
jgi:hypothetical protein